MENITPQLEYGYIKMATDIARYLARTHMNSYQSRILWVIFIKTYGFHKKEDWISNSQFVSETGISPSHVCRAVRELVMMNIVTKRGNKISFQKDARLWEKLPNGASRHDVTKRGNVVTKRGNSELPNGAIPIYTKDTITKDTYTKDIVATKVANLNEFMDLFKGVNPSHERLFANKTQRAALERMILKFGEEKVRNMLTQLPSIVSKPYAPQISTPVELENKLGKLVQFISQEKLKVKKSGFTQV